MKQHSCQVDGSLCVVIIEELIVFRIVMMPIEKEASFAVAYPGILFRGVQQIQLTTEGRENWDLQVAAP